MCYVLIRIGMIESLTGGVSMVTAIRFIEERYFCG